MNAPTTFQSPDPIQFHNRLLEALIATAVMAKMPKADIARMVRGLVLDEFHLNLLGLIAHDAADTFYEAVKTTGLLLNRQADTNTRLYMAKKFMSVFTNTADRIIKVLLKHQMKIGRTEKLFIEPSFKTMTEPAKIIAEHCLITHGEFGLGERLIVDRFSAYYNHVIGINTHEDAIKGSFPLFQVYITAHEGGHSLDSFFETRNAAGMPFPCEMRQSLSRISRVKFSEKENFEAYKASPREQSAEYCGHKVAERLYDRILQDMVICDPAMQQEIELALEEERSTLTAIIGRSKFDSTADDYKNQMLEAGLKPEEIAELFKTAQALSPR